MEQVFYPLNDVDVGKRFFFFSSLLGKDNILANTTTNMTASDLAEKAQDIIVTGMDENFNTQNDDGKTRMELALDFLKRIIERDRANEEEFFTNKINSTNNEVLKEELQSCFENGEIKYLKFINTINEYLKDSEQYRVELEYEVARLKKLDELYIQFANISNKEKQLLAQNRKKNENNSAVNRGSRYYEDLKYYIYNILEDTEQEKKQTEAIQAYNSQTIANNIQSIFNRLFYQIWNEKSAMELVIARLKGQNVDITSMSYLLSSWLSIAKKEIQDYLEKQDRTFSPLNTQDIEKIANMFINDFKNENNNDNNESKKKKLQAILTQTRKLLQQPDHNNYRSRFFTNKTKEIGLSKKGNIKGLTEQQLGTNLFNLLIEKATEEYDALVSKDSKVRVQTDKQENETARAQLIRIIEGIYRRAAKDIKERRGQDKKDFIINTINEYIQEAQGDGIVQMNSQNRIISEMITVGDISPLAKHSGTILSSVDFSKADVAAYVGSITVAPSKKLKRIIKQMSNQIAETYYQTRNEAITKNMSNAESKYRKTRGFKKTEFNIAAETARRLSNFNELYEAQVEEIKRREKNIKEQEENIKTLKNSFTIEASVKSYDKLTRQGFHGGSLGGSVEHQIENIQTMLSIGGITPIDADWLAFAVYNAGSHLVGGGYKTQLENYFSTIAATMLFDDAGQQATYIQEQAFDNYFEPSIKTVHIYNLNGIFIPESFVLQLTYNGLQKARIMLEGISSNGSRAYITNTVSEANIVNVTERTKKQKIKTTEHKTSHSSYNNLTWSDTFEHNAGSVSINITFLAGFLDILDKLQGAMTNITTQ